MFSFSVYEILFMVIWYAAALVNGISGLGGAMVAVPLLAFFMPAQVLVPVSGILALVMSFEMGYIYFKDCDGTVLKWAVLGGFPGLAAGTAVLMLVPAKTLQLFIGVIMILFALWQLKDKRAYLPHSATNLKSMLTGFASGCLCTSISFAGPPVAVYALHIGATQKQAFALISVLTGIMYSAGFCFQAGAGLFDGSVFRWIAIGVLPVILGTVNAAKLAPKVNVIFFRVILKVIILLGGISCVPSLIPLTATAVKYQ